MPEQLVTVERTDSNIAILRIDRPKMNALSRELLDQLAQRVGELEAELPGAVVVWGGERIFAAGADISEFSSPELAEEVAEGFHGALDALAALERVTIAAVCGYALGGGCELALACDFRLAGSNAKLGQPEVLLGIIPGGGGTQRLPRLIGVARAKELILSGRQIGADEALSIGLVDRVVEPDAVFGEAILWAEAFAKGAVVAQGLAKQAIDGGLGRDLPAGLQSEQELFVRSFRTEDAKLGIDSFKEHGPGKARFVGR